MKRFKKITIYSLSILYIVVGTKHFTNSEFFITIVPPIISLKKEVVLISGFFEIILGICLLFKSTRKFASIGIILLLISVFPANIYLYTSEIARDILKISKSQALFRMPFQITLIILAYWHSIEKSSKKFSILNLIIFIPTILYFILISL